MRLFLSAKLPNESVCRSVRSTDTLPFAGRGKAVFHCRSALPGAKGVGLQATWTGTLNRWQPSTPPTTLFSNGMGTRSIRNDRMRHGRLLDGTVLTVHKEKRYDHHDDSKLQLCRYGCHPTPCPLTVTRYYLVGSEKPLNFVNIRTFARNSGFESAMFFAKSCRFGTKSCRFILKNHPQSPLSTKFCMFKLLVF